MSKKNEESFPISSRAPFHARLLIENVETGLRMRDGGQRMFFR